MTESPSDGPAKKSSLPEKESQATPRNEKGTAVRHPPRLSVRILPMEDPRTLDMALDMLLTEFIRQEISREEET